MISDCFPCCLLDDNTFSLSLLAGTEWIGVTKRSWGACLSQLFTAVGQCIVVGVIYAIRDWRLVQLITAAQLTVFFIYIWCAFSLKHSCIILMVSF